jgi:hypothetical protein
MFYEIHYFVLNFLIWFCAILFCATTLQPDRELVYLLRLHSGVRGLTGVTGGATGNCSQDICPSDNVIS